MSSAQTFDFGSVGDRVPTLREHESASFEKREFNVNPRTPLKLSEKKSELFIMNTNLVDAVADNLRNVLLTNRGERVMQPDLGANLKAILSEFGTPGFETEVMARINSAVSKYMPFVSLSTMSMEKIPSPPSDGLVIVRFNIKYSIPSARVTGEEISVTLSTIA